MRHRVRPQCFTAHKQYEDFCYWNDIVQILWVDSNVMHHRFGCVLNCGIN